MNPNLSRWFAIVVPVVCLVAANSQLPAQPTPARDLSLLVGKSLVVSSERRIERVAVGFGDIAEAMSAGTSEVLVSGKAPGSTSLIVWQEGGGKLFFDVNVRPNPFVANARLDRVREQIAKELPDQNITVSFEDDSVFLRGNAKDLISVGRAMAISSTLGRVI